MKHQKTQRTILFIHYLKKKSNITADTGDVTKYV